MTNPEQQDNRALLCFDADYRVLFISSLAAELVFLLFNCRPQIQEVLPDAVRTSVPIVKENKNPLAEIQASRRPLTFKREDGSSVYVRLVTLDHGKAHYCLIFECESALSNPQQLKALGLSARETEVAYWVLQHKTNWEIGKILKISPRTVDKHVERIFSKLDVNNRSQLIEKARELRDN